MGLTIAPIEIRPFQVTVLVLKHLLVIHAVCGRIEVTHDIRPPDSGWGVMAIVT
jgi:hypothetical protein